MKSAVHHWWPRKLSEFWQNDEGGLHRLRPDRSVDKIRHDNAGGIKNAHQIKFSEGSPWNTDFESQFAEVDSRWPEIVSLVEGYAERALPIKNGTTTCSIRSCEFEDSDRDKIAANLASMGLRSPAFRNSIRSGVESFNDQELSERDKLIPLNMLHSFSDFHSSMRRRGKFLALICENVELIFGDGFLCNFSIPSFNFQRGRMLFPLTPKLAIFYDSPNFYKNDHYFYVYNANPEEVHMINRYTQIYSGKEIFYSRVEPIFLMNSK